MPNTDKWNPVQPGFEPFWGIVSQSGNVIALRVASEELTRQICDEHNSLVADKAAEQVEVYSHPDCIFNYCPTPEQCKPKSCFNLARSCKPSAH
jgi:hypothetical protein